MKAGPLCLQGPDSLKLPGHRAPRLPARRERHTPWLALRSRTDPVQSQLRWNSAPPLQHEPHVPSSLAWLDHDTAARDRTRRLLALFHEKGTQDQLGLGAIRDSISDLLFPGTSTIQTRIRYFLLVPWIYSRLEEERVPASRFGAEARQREVDMIEPLLSSEEEGVFGRSAGGDLKRLPSEIYWGGLGSWGIRRFQVSRDVYHRSVDEIYRRRDLSRHSSSEGTEAGPGLVTWHPELPPPPPSFPGVTTLSLRRDEAEFLVDRIVASHPTSLLAWLALRPTTTDTEFAWDHPRFGEMSLEHQRILTHARLFSKVMNGAAILYNWMLSRKAGLDELVEAHRNGFHRWAEALDLEAIRGWSIPELVAIARAQGSHRISPQTERFVSRWVDMVRAGALEIPDSEEAEHLIRNREMLLKGARSLFRNRRALDEKYQGRLGLGRFEYRWPDVQRHLNDLHDGLEQRD